MKDRRPSTRTSCSRTPPIITVCTTPWAPIVKGLSRLKRSQVPKSDHRQRGGHPRLVAVDGELLPLAFGIIEDGQAMSACTSNQTSHMALCLGEFVVALAAGSAVVIAILICGFIRDLLLA